MSFKIATIAALLASIASATPLVTRQSTGSVNFVNKLSTSIPFILVGESGTIQSGTAAPGSTTNLPMSPDKAGYSLKLAAQGGNPASANNILQFEYTYSSDNGGIVTFDWSDVNGPDPYGGNTRTITPSNIGSQPSCQVETCNPGQDTDSCEFVNPVGYQPGTCSDTSGVVLTATIS